MKTTMTSSSNHYFGFMSLAGLAGTALGAGMAALALFCAASTAQAQIGKTTVRRTPG